MPPVLQIKLLGGFSFVGEGAALSGSFTGRSQVLLTYLILHRQAPQPRQRLAFQLWSDSTDTQARTNLRKELSNLRRALPNPDQLLVIDARSLHWQPSIAVTIDVAQFEESIQTAATQPHLAQIALEQALALYQGDLLPACEDEWIVPERDRLQQMYVSALEQLIDLLKNQREYRSALGYAQQLLRVDPLNESTYCTLMRLHELSGDRANALQVYHRCMTVLREELGVDPSVTTRKLYEQLLREEEATNSATNETITSASTARNAVVQASIATDWGEAPDVSVFYGRETERSTLQHWIGRDRCRLVLLLGMGGIGKTTLAVKLAQDIQHKFECVIWRSLRNAPPLETLLADLILVVSNQQDTEISPSRLLRWLRQSRCLVVLDNMETILQGGERAGYYRPGYEDYGELLRLVAETVHQSCLLLTSREKPAEVGIFEGVDLAVRTLPLAGSQAAAIALLNAKGLVGSDVEKQQLGDRYSYSPLALKIVATSIQSLFNGEIAPFLQQDSFVFNGIRRLLNQQFERLTWLERTIMYWLAINREWTSIAELLEDIVPTVARSNLLESLESLTWRSLIEVQSGQYTQQPVVMEYVTDDLVERVATELVTQRLQLFDRHALIKTTVKDYVRESQVRLILGAIAHQIRTVFTTDAHLKQHISQTLETLHYSKNQFNYACGNLINLCSQLQIDLTGLDFSNLNIWHAHLQKVNLHRVNFNNANFAKTVFTQTFGGILVVKFSLSSQYLAAADTSGEIWLWRTHSANQTLNQTFTIGQPHLNLQQAHTDWVCTIDFSPDEQMLASASDDQTIKIWDTQTGRCLQILPCGSKVRAVAWSLDQQFLASSGVDQPVRIWEPYLGQCLKTLEGHHSNKITTVAWKPSRSSITQPVLATSGTDRTIRIWDTDTGECLAILEGHENAVLSIAWSPDGCTLASCGSDQTIRLWDFDTKECLNILEGHQDTIYAIAWSPDGQALVSGSDDQTVRVWNAYTGQCLRVLQRHQNSVRSVAWSPDGQVLVSGSFDQTIRLWNAQFGSQLKILQGYRNTILSVSWHPNGRILASGGDDCQVRVWDSQTGECLHILQGHSQAVWAVVWSPDGQTLASSGDDQTIKLWDLKTEQCLKTLDGHSSLIWALAWSPNGQILASGSHDQTIRLWNPWMGRCLRVLAGHQNWVRKLAWSPDGQMLASGSYDQTLRLWNPINGTCLKIFRDPSNWVWAIAFAPDGKTLASGSTSGELKLWDIATETCLFSIKAHKTTLWSMMWSPDGQTLVSSSHDQTIKCWRASDGECLSALHGHTNIIWASDLSSDGRSLASGGADELIHLWDITTGSCLKTLQPKRPYEGTNITGVQGLTEAQKVHLKALGAIEEEISGHE